MPVQQTLPQRYVDKQKLIAFWRTHPDFMGKACSIKLERSSYVIQVPRAMTQAEIQSVYYDQASLEQMESDAGT